VATFSFKKEKNIVPSKGNNYTALYWWLDTADFSHSLKVRSGYCIENYIRDLVVSSPLNYSLLGTGRLKISNNKNKQADCLFGTKNSLGVITSVFYREIKANVNLDTEKDIANKEKILEISKTLTNFYPGISINPGLLCPSHLDSTPSKNIEGFNDFISLIGYDTITFSKYQNIGQILGKTIRSYYAV